VSDPKDKQTARNPSSRWDLLVALALGVTYMLAVMATTGMGFTRDEVFYFRFAKTYVNWFVELERAESAEERTQLISREKVKSVWRKNFEHPPLMKVLFGTSWKFLGIKRRPVKITRNGHVVVEKLGLAHGFEPGEQVLLLRPTQMGEDPGTSERIIAEIDVLERTKGKATGDVVDFAGSAEELVELCDVVKRSGDRKVQTGCEARTSQWSQVLSESDAFRFPGAAMGGLLVALLYLFAVAFTSRGVALLASLLLATIPRLFFHSHLTCFDVPITAVNFLVIFAFWKSLSSRPWAVITGVLWGIALLTKNNSFFVPIALGLWWLISVAPGVGLEKGKKGLRLPPFPRAFVWMPLLGLPMLFLFWPWLWYDSINAFGKYLGFHLHHEHYFQYYFGRAYQSPPFPVDFPFVMTLYTLPTVTLALFSVGMGSMFIAPLIPWFRHRSPPGQKWRELTFLGVSLAFPVLLIAMPSTPIFGGVKHWFLSMPYLCLVAAAGLVEILRSGWLAAVRLGLPNRALFRGALAVVVCGLILAPGARDTFKYRDNGTAYYNQLIGGARGAADRQMQRQFWSYANRGALQWVNENARQGAVVDFQDALPGACNMYKLEGWLRHDLHCAVRHHAPDLLLFDVEERFSEEEQRYWKKMKSAAPAHEITVDGVPVLRVYEKEK
jgi:4-amino-4-deoxy-L-arabinose transferase-like glycosyltransferase